MIVSLALLCCVTKSFFPISSANIDICLCRKQIRHPKVLAFITRMRIIFKRCLHSVKHFHANIYYSNYQIFAVNKRSSNLDGFHKNWPALSWRKYKNNISQKCCWRMKNCLRSGRKALYQTPDECSFFCAVSWWNSFREPFQLSLPMFVRSNLRVSNMHTAARKLYVLKSRCKLHVYTRAQPLCIRCQLLACAALVYVWRRVRCVLRYSDVKTANETAMDSLNMCAPMLCWSYSTVFSIFYLKLTLFFFLSLKV